MLLLLLSVNDTIIKTSYKDIEFASFAANDCVKELQVRTPGDGFVYLTAYDNSDNSGDIMRFPYRGIAVQGFSNPDNSDRAEDCIYSFFTEVSGGYAYLNVVYDGTSRNDPDTVQVLKVAYKGIYLNDYGIPSSTGGYHAIKEFIAGTNEGNAFLRADTSATLTPVGDIEIPGSDVGKIEFALRVGRIAPNVVQVVYAIPSKGHVKLEVYSVSGRRVLFVSGERERGIYRVSRFLPKGSYVVRLSWNDRVVVQKFVNF